MIKLLPVISTFFRDINISIVRAHIQQIESSWRLGNCRDGSIRHIPGSSPVSKIATDGNKTISLIHRSVQTIAADIKNILVVFAKQDRSLPVKAQRLFTQFMIGPYAFSVASCFSIQPAIESELRTRIRGRIVSCIHLYLHPITTD